MFHWFEFLQADGGVTALTEATRKELAGQIDRWAIEDQTVVMVAMQTMHIGSSHQPFPKEMPGDEDITCIALLALQAPVRHEVPHAVARLHTVGTLVRMTSGDALPATRNVAAKCGIHTPGTGGLDLEGAKFADLCRTDMTTLSGALPQIQVSAVHKNRSNLVVGGGQHSPNTPTTGLRERGNDTSKSTGRSGRQNAATRRNMRREERVTVQGPVKEQQPDGMSHRGGAICHSVTDGE